MKCIIRLSFLLMTSLAHTGFISLTVQSRMSVPSLQESKEVSQKLNKEILYVGFSQEQRTDDVNAKKKTQRRKPDVAFKSGFSKEVISAIPKGQRPLPTSYLKRKYVFRHIRRFQKEGIVSRIVSKNDYVHFGIGKPDRGKTEFVGLKSEMDFLLSLPLQEQAEKLGIPIEQLQNGNLMRVNFTLSRRYKAHMPTGNEFGANPKWIPGGKLPTGLHEAVIYTEGMTLNVHYFVTNL